MKINKYVRTLIFCIGCFVIYCAMDYIVKRWLVIPNFEYMYIIEAIVTVLVCSLLEHVFYDFDPSHNGDVALKSK